MARIRRASILQDVRVFADAHVMFCGPIVPRVPAERNRNFLPVAILVRSLTPPAVVGDVLENEIVWHSSGEHQRIVEPAGSRRWPLVKVICNNLHAAFERVGGGNSLSINETIKCDSARPLS